MQTAFCTQDVQSPGGTSTACLEPKDTLGVHPALLRGSEPSTGPGVLGQCFCTFPIPCRGFCSCSSSQLSHSPLPNPTDIPPSAQAEFQTVFCFWFRQCLKPRLCLEAWRHLLSIDLIHTEASWHLQVLPGGRGRCALSLHVSKQLYPTHNILCPFHTLPASPFFFIPYQPPGIYCLLSDLS